MNHKLARLYGPGHEKREEDFLEEKLAQNKPRLRIQACDLKPQFFHADSCG